MMYVFVGVEKSLSIAVGIKKVIIHFLNHIHSQTQQ